MLDGKEVRRSSVLSMRSLKNVKVMMVDSALATREVPFAVEKSSYSPTYKMENLFLPEIKSPSSTGLKISY